LPRRPDPDLHTGQVSSGLLAMTEEVFLVYGLSIYFERIVTKMDLSHYNKPYQRKLVSSYGGRGTLLDPDFRQDGPLKKLRNLCALSTIFIIGGVNCN
jgi:hypothetical protein